MSEISYSKSKELAKENTFCQKETCEYFNAGKTQNHVIFWEKCADQKKNFEINVSKKKKITISK